MLMNLEKSKLNIHQVTLLLEQLQMQIVFLKRLSEAQFLQHNRGMEDIVFITLMIILAVLFPSADITGKRVTLNMLKIHLGRFFIKS